MEKKFNPNWDNINTALCYLSVGVTLLVGLTTPLAKRQQLTDEIQKELNRRGIHE